jgi:hypothetical protein
MQRYHLVPKQCQKSKLKVFQISKPQFVAFVLENFDSSAPVSLGSMGNQVC